MHFQALATDYDGTIAHDGVVSKQTVDALRRLRGTGRKLILVTGREVEDLQRIFEHVALFEWIVAENGALLFQSQTKETVALGAAPPRAFVQALVNRGVKPLDVGHVIVATYRSFAPTILEVIHEQALDYEVIFNKGSVMVLPSGMNKAVGLEAALPKMGLSAQNVVAVGDAENDIAFLQMCGCAVAVANALPAVREAANFTTNKESGAGVEELIEELVTTDLQSSSGIPKMLLRPKP